MNARIVLSSDKPGEMLAYIEDDVGCLSDHGYITAQAVETAPGEYELKLTVKSIYAETQKG